MKRFLPLLVFAALILPLGATDRPLPVLMPMPLSVRTQAGDFQVDKNFALSLTAPADSRAASASTRFLKRLRDRTGLFLSQGIIVANQPVAAAALTVRVDRTGALRVGEDESYKLRVGPEAITLEAPTDLGALRGFETLLQLLSSDRNGYIFPAVTIEDAPRFVWRGLMLDVARHFLPLDVIKRNLDGMAAVKLNVLHLHLTEDQGFRIESKTFPQLHLQGSDGDFFTHEQIREIIRYADQRGIRVYPEFDVPGHATSWLIGHPELASIDRKYSIERKWGIFDPALDPSKPEVYALLEGFFTEMAGLFPDEYIHIGGDEVNGKDWAASARIQAFMRENNIADAHQLQTHFNQRILPILTRLKKKVIGWDEIFQPGMPNTIVIHSWRGREAMAQAAKQGYQSILSNGFYIDLMHPAADHYLNDPVPVDTPLNAEEAARVLGGEATMWAEHVTAETVDSRIWPRVGAIAERLWSAREIRDVESMYRRLNTLAIQLEEHGLTHIKNRGMLMRRLVGQRDPAALEALANVVEPLKVYARNSDESYTQFSPYVLLPDIATADAPDALTFRRLIDAYQKRPDDASLLAEINAWLKRWEENHGAFSELAEAAPALREALPLSEALRDVARLGLEATGFRAKGQKPDYGWIARSQEQLEKAKKPVAKVELQVIEALRTLITFQP